MASQAQRIANRANAQASTGPATAAGKSASSRNATKFGLFTTNNCVLPGEQPEYAALCNRLWRELDAVGALEEATAAEYVRAVWRLRRCAMAEERLGWRSEWFQQDYNHRNNENLPPSDPAINEQTMAAQTAVDRARAQAQNAMRRAKTELDKLQATRSTRTLSQNEPNSGASSDRDEPVLQNEADSGAGSDCDEPVLQNEADPPRPLPAPAPVAPSRSPRPYSLPCPCGSGLPVAMCLLVTRHTEPETETPDPQPPETIALPLAG
jgi:hypothetical protein